MSPHDDKDRRLMDLTPRPRLAGRVMNSTVHIKHPDQPYQAVCGQGYPWPSSIAFEKPDHQPATCKACLAFRKKDHPDD